MDIRYVLLGVNIAVFGGLIALYGYLVASSQLIGVASSLMLIGLVLFVLGYTYMEPTTSLLIDYSKEVSRFASIILEDLRLSNSLPRTAIDGDKVYLMLSNINPEEPSNLSPGLNIVDGEPVLLIPIDASLESPVPTSLYEVESRLRDRLVGEYGLCNSLEVRGGGDTYSLRLSGIDPRLLELELAPLNPIDVVVVSSLTSILGRGLEFVRRVLEAGEYRAELRVVG